MSERVIDMPEATNVVANDILYLIRNSADDMQVRADTLLSFLGGGVSPMGVAYRFSDSTLDSDPGDGMLRLNNSTQLSATVIRADNLDTGGANVTALLEAFDDSSSTNKGYLRLYGSTDPTKWITFSITSVATMAGYYNITVSPIAGSGTNPFVVWDYVTLAFVRTGDKGEIGDTGADGALWYFGTGVPAGGLGVDGDMYYRTTTNDVYNKAAGVWSIIGNLQGDTGAAGNGIASYFWMSDKPPTTGTHKRFYTDRDGLIQWCRGEVENGDGSSTTNFDVKKNGTTIYPTSTKPSVSAGQFIGTERLPDTIDFVKGDYFEIVVTDTGGTLGRLRLLVNFSYEGV